MTRWRFVGIVVSAVAVVALMAFTGPRPETEVKSAVTRRVPEGFASSWSSGGCSAG